MIESGWAKVAKGPTGAIDLLRKQATFFNCMEDASACCLGMAGNTKLRHNPIAFVPTSTLKQQLQRARSCNEPDMSAEIATSVADAPAQASQRLPTC